MLTHRFLGGPHDGLTAPGIPYPIGLHVSVDFEPCPAELALFPNGVTSHHHRYEGRRLAGWDVLELRYQGPVPESPHWRRACEEVPMPAPSPEVVANVT